MNRAMLRWSGIGLFVCALAATAVSLWLNLHTLIAKPVDATFTGIATSLLFWALASLELSAHLRRHARPPGNETKLRFDVHTLFLDDAPLGVPLTALAMCIVFLLVITALTFGIGLSGMLPAAQRQLAGEVLLAQAVINFCFMLLGGVFSVRGHPA